MKKLLLISIIALQGASMLAMDSSEEELTGEARSFYDEICQSFHNVSVDKMKAGLEKFSDLPNWTTMKYRPLLHTFIIANNVEVVRLLLLNGADVDTKYDGKSVMDVAYNNQPIRELLEKFKRGEDSALKESSVEDDKSIDNEELGKDNEASWLSNFSYGKGVVISTLVFIGCLAFREYYSRKGTKA